MSEILEKAVRSLVQLTWLRDFRSDADLVKKTFQEKVPVFVSTLRKRVQEVQSQMHPSQTLELDVATTFAVCIREHGRSEPLAICHVHTEKVGTLEFKFSAAGYKEETYSLNLECYGERRYCWADEDGNQFIVADPVADLCLKKLIDKAFTVVAEEVESIGVNEIRPDKGEADGKG